MTAPSAEEGAAADPDISSELGCYRAGFLLALDSTN